MPEITDQIAIIWNQTLNTLRSRTNDQIYNAWFSPIKPLSIENDFVSLAVPNDFFKEWVLERYSDLIKKAISEAAGKELNLSFVITPTQKETTEEEAKKTKKTKKGLLGAIFPKASQDQKLRQIGLNAKYTFDVFVVGPSNRFAHAASMAVSESPAKTYNPLFIYGGVGLGKTHLMHAIANSISGRNPKSKILYLSSEDFTNQLINAIRTRSTREFRQQYRNVDVLLIDDIHFIAGKESTQEEFFHTFNALYDANKQIVISSDRPPKEISTLEERLVSRFGWGLVTDIQAPDFETRIAILKKKSEKETVRLSDDLFYFLGENIRTNIRELEGALIRVVAYAKLTGKEISVDLAKEVLRGMIKEGEKKISIDLIQKKVAEYFSISSLDMKTKRRTQAIAYPRQIAMYLSRDLTPFSLPEIGGYFGGRDHTTVIHACNKVEKDIKEKNDVRRMIEKLVVSIKG